MLDRFYVISLGVKDEQLVIEAYDKENEKRLIQRL